MIIYQADLGSLVYRSVINIKAVHLVISHNARFSQIKQIVGATLGVYDSRDGARVPCQAIDTKGILIVTL